MKRTTRAFGIMTFGFIGLALPACGGDGLAAQNQPESPAFAIALDTTIQPPQSSLPGLNAGPPRPLAGLVDSNGLQAEFVANELVLVTDDVAARDTFVARWHGRILRSFVPADLTLPGVAMHLIQVDTSSVDVGTLLADVKTLFPNSQGSYGVSSQDGLRLLAAAGREAVSGVAVGVNWVMRGAQYRDRITTDAPMGPSSPGYSGYTDNAFDWPHLSSADPLRVGVAEAWRALELAGRLGNRVPIAIVDGGFAPNADFPTGPITVGSLNTENPARCTGGTVCPWHGTQVLGAAMAVPDNGYGAAGTAGPVAAPIIVSMPGDFFTAVSAIGDALRQAGNLRPRIINISAGAALPAIVEWTTRWLADSISISLRAAGVLIVVSAGNEGESVDAQDCLVVLGFTVGCWERTWYVPCEMAGVTCVGAMGRRDLPNRFNLQRAEYSNYGTDPATDTVDLFAPGSVWVGPDPEFSSTYPGNRVQWFDGTSAASPFVAGVAGLVLAANPGLSADAVESCLISTARPNPDGSVRRYVNAYGAVICALGNTPPEISITAPAHNASFLFGSSVAFSAVATDVEDGTPGVRWVVDSVFRGTGLTLQVPGLALGSHNVFATATDRGGFTVSDGITITIVTNLPPTVSITSPATDVSLPFDGYDPPFSNRIYVDVLLAGTATDPEDGSLTGASLVWTTSRSDIQPSLLGTGPSVSVRLYSNACGSFEHVITLTATDSVGVSRTAVRRITIELIC